jgi:hypothetical protein
MIGSAFGADLPTVSFVSAEAGCAPTISASAIAHAGSSGA